MAPDTIHGLLYIKYLFHNDEKIIHLFESLIYCDNLFTIGGICLGMNVEVSQKYDVARTSTAVDAVVTEYQGVTGHVEKESDDCWTCFFTVPKEDGDVDTYKVSLYNMGKDGFVLSLEVDASDNRLSEESDRKW